MNILKVKFCYKEEFIVNLILSLGKYYFLCKLKIKNFKSY